MISSKVISLYTTVFVSGLSVMGIELSASRLLAPLFGSSIYVWTNIIGIILISLSLGYFFGGKIADRYPEIRLFYMFSLIAGFFTALIVLFYSFIIPLTIQSLSSNSYNQFLLSFIYSLLLFAFPTAFLGAIVPFAIRINSQQINKIGKTSGNIYTISTIGSIIGVYLPALVLIPILGTRFTICFFSILLIVTSLINLLLTLDINYLKKGIISVFVILFLLTSNLFVFQPSSNEEIIFEGESPYNYLRVIKNKDSVYLMGKLYGGIWSKKIDNKFFTGGVWDYFLVSNIFVNKIKNILILGLAAGTTAKSCSIMFPNATIDGVDIDPLVIEIGRKYFDMNIKKLKTVISDGRLYVKSTNKKYDLIILDVYRDAYIPSYMATVEFFKEINKILTPDGILSLNIIEISNNRLLLHCIGNTLLQIFSDLYFVKVPDSINYVLYATKTNFDLNEIKRQILTKRDNISLQIPQDDELTIKTVFTEVYIGIEKFNPTNDNILTDDRSPVEAIIGSNAFFPTIK